MAYLPMQVDRMVQRIVARYEFHRRRTSPNYRCSSIAKREQSVLEDTAKFVLDCKGVPEAIVDVLFDMFGQEYSGSPYLSMLKNSQLRETYKNLDAYQEQKAITSFKLMWSLFEAHVKAGRTPVSILTDASLYFSPVFRFGVAKKLGYNELANSFIQAAVENAEADPVHFRVVQEKLGVTNAPTSTVSPSASAQ